VSAAVYARNANVASAPAAKGTGSTSDLNERIDSTTERPFINEWVSISRGSTGLNLFPSACTSVFVRAPRSEIDGGPSPSSAAPIRRRAGGRDSCRRPVSAAVNHVPNEALAAIDAFGEGHLRGDPPPVRERLRSDLRIRIEVNDDGRTARCRFETEYTRTPPTLRDRDSFLVTYVDGVDERLREWGIEPPPAYEYRETVDGTHRYEGTLTLP